MSDFFAPPPPQQPPQPGPSPMGVPPMGTPPTGPVPGMPGYSGYQHQMVQAQVYADAPPAVPLSLGNATAAAGALGGLLMIVGGIGSWVKVSFASFFPTESIGGLHAHFNGGIVLGLGIAALLAAGTAITSQGNRQIRQIAAAALLALGIVGLIVVVHDWTTLSDHVRQANDVFKSITSSLSAASGTSPLPPGLQDIQLHVAKGWGLILSGVASAITGLAGAYLLLAK